MLEILEATNIPHLLLNLKVFKNHREIVFMEFKGRGESAVKNQRTGEITQ
jgi:hypothetical protein